MNGRFTCDNDHVVGFGPGLDYNVRPFNGLKGLFFSGEALVYNEFSGQGSVGRLGGGRTSLPSCIRFGRSSRQQ